jgi:hypothetical protein
MTKIEEKIRRILNNHNELAAYTLIIRSPAHVRAFVRFFPDESQRFFSIFEHNRDDSSCRPKRDKIIGPAFVKKYKSDAQYNSSAYFISLELNAPINRLISPLCYYPPIPEPLPSTNYRTNPPRPDNLFLLGTLDNTIRLIEDFSIDLER